jgi:hypothetical protein
MPLITVGQHPQLDAKSTQSAPGRAVMALQAETGKKLAELRAEGAYSESLNVFIMAYLSLKTAGIDEPWADLIERPLADIVIEPTQQELREEADAKKEAEDQAVTDPQQASTASPQEDSDAPEPDVTRPPTGSKKKHN